MLACALALSGCYEAIEHQAPDPADAGTSDAGTACASSEECPCGHRCESADAGHVCALYQPIACMHSIECTSLVCAESHRLGHTCGSLECQP